MIFIKEKSMKNLFELSEEEKNKIRGLHESYKSKPGTSLIWEQTENVALEKLNEKINSIILSKTDSYASNVNVQLDFEGTPQKPNFYLSFYLNSDPDNKKQIFIPTEDPSDLKGLTFDVTKLSDFYSEIFIDPDLKKIYDTNIDVKNQMDNKIIKLEIVPTNNPALNVTIEQMNNSRENRNSKRYVKGTITTLNNFFNNAGVYFGVDKNTIIAIEAGGMAINLQKIKINEPEPITPPNPNTKIVDEFSFTLTDPFEFDEDVLTSEGKTNLNFELEKLNNFIKFCFNKGKLNQILDTNVVVKGFASSDGDPSSNQIGKLQACQNTKTRGEYDKCLSQKRADLIAKTLNNYLSNIKVEQPTGKVTVGSLYQRGVENWANPIGVGQDSSKTGIDWKTPHKSSDTAKDRRVEFTPTLSIKN
jgi:outer membrane protein OmpA-like peptidoglycan-associated protein